MGINQNLAAMNTAFGAMAQQQRNREAARQAGDTNALLVMLVDAQVETNQLLRYIAELLYNWQSVAATGGPGAPGGAPEPPA